MSHPELENEIFNERISHLGICAFCYDELVSAKALTPLESLDKKTKDDLKSEVLRIDPFRSLDKGMKMAKMIYLFGWLSNQ